MKRLLPQFVAAFILCSVVLVPHFARAFDLNLIVCDPTVKGKECDYASLITLIKNLINDLIVLSTVLVTAALMFVGIRLLTEGDKVDARKELKNTGWTIVKGYLIILSAWFLVYTITSVLLNPGYSVLGKP